MKPSRKTYVYSLSIGLVFLTALFFQNCGNVNVSKPSEELQSVAEIPPVVPPITPPVVPPVVTQPAPEVVPATNPIFTGAGGQTWEQFLKVIFPNNPDLSQQNRHAFNPTAPPQVVKDNCSTYTNIVYQEMPWFNAYVAGAYPLQQFDLIHRGVPENDVDTVYVLHFFVPFESMNDQTNRLTIMLAELAPAQPLWRQTGFSSLPCWKGTEVYSQYQTDGSEIVNIKPYAGQYASYGISRGRDYYYNLSTKVGTFQSYGQTFNVGESCAGQLSCDFLLKFKYTRSTD